MSNFASAARNKMGKTAARNSLSAKDLGCMKSALNPIYVQIAKKITTGPQRIKGRKYSFGVGGAAARAEKDWLTPEVKRPEKLRVPCSYSWDRATISGLPHCSHRYAISCPVAAIVLLLIWPRQIQNPFNQGF
jgi:hypothetical protein